MELTGKCKEDFEKWYPTRDGGRWLNSGMALVTYFYYLDGGYGEKKKEMSISNQWGVYQDFFDSVGIELVSWKICQEDTFLFSSMAHKDYEMGNAKYYKLRNDSRVAALKESNELYNEHIKETE